MRFHDSITGRNKRETVLVLMRKAGAEDDTRTFTRLLVENPISRASADKAWRQGVAFAAARKARGLGPGHPWG